MKNDDVLGEYFTGGNPWSRRPWKDFNYWNGWYALARLRAPRSILEIGTAFGFSTVALAGGAGKSLHLLVSLDLGNFGRLFTHKGYPEFDNLAYVRDGIARYRAEQGLDFEYMQFRVNTQPPPLTDNEGSVVGCPYWREDPRLLDILRHTRFDLILIDGKHTGDGLYNDLVSFFDYGGSRCLVICDDLQDSDTLGSFARFLGERERDIADYCIWRYLSSTRKYGGARRRDQGLLLKR
ncbi:MAG: class I SAM-dependent methyltransferase [Gemmatimonadota bacterium]